MEAGDSFDLYSFVCVRVCLSKTFSFRIYRKYVFQLPFLKKIHFVLCVFCVCHFEHRVKVELNELTSEPN